MANIPIGVRFKPTKLQLITYFLCNKIEGKPLPPFYPQLLDYDAYSHHPYQLLLSTKDARGVNDVEEGYFFSHLSKASPNGKRVSRCIKGQGTWSEKSKTKKVYDNNMNVVGIDKYFKFKPLLNDGGNDDGGEWMMHQYSVVGNNEIVLCHITKKPHSHNNDDDADASSSRGLKRGRCGTYATSSVALDMEECSASKRAHFDNNQDEPMPIIMNNPNTQYYCPVVPQIGNDDNCGVEEVEVEAEGETSNKALTAEIEGLLGFEEKGGGEDQVISMKVEEYLMPRGGFESSNTAELVDHGGFMLDDNVVNNMLSHDFDQQDPPTTQYCYCPVAQGYEDKCGVEVEEARNDTLLFQGDEARQEECDNNNNVFNEIGMLDLPNLNLEDYYPMMPGFELSNTTTTTTTEFVDDGFMDNNDIINMHMGSLQPLPDFLF